jgi:hypothetical protein
MPAHRFKLELDGQTVYGLAFASEAELKQFCNARGLEPTAQPAAPVDPLGDEQRPRGRPSYSAMLEAGVQALEPEIGSGDNLSARARVLLRYLAQSYAAEELPSTSTVRAFLADRAAVAEKSANKSANKSKRARIRRTGGT